MLLSIITKIIFYSQILHQNVKLDIVMAIVAFRYVLYQIHYRTVVFNP